MQSASQSQLVVVGFIAEVSHDSKIVYNIFSIGLIERLTACIQPLSPSQLLNTNGFTASLVTVVDKWALVRLSGYIYQQWHNLLSTLDSAATVQGQLVLYCYVQ